MEKYLVIAEEGELKLAEQLGFALTEDRKHTTNGYTLVITGVGAFNILKSLKSLPQDAEVVNIGYAGSANFDIGTIVEVTESRLNHPNVTYPEPTCELFVEKDSPYTKAVCYSGTDFILQSDYKDCVFDMELAFIAGLGFKHLRSLKHVSDNLSLHAYHELTHGVE
ncbi:MAG: hypothetical protein MJZ92_02480 [Paludibacteraceae bacterium]|nr:hypothetical protein [Paludibacteraceae bacterium]